MLEDLLGRTSLVGVKTPVSEVIITLTSTHHRVLLLLLNEPLNLSFSCLFRHPFDQNQFENSPWVYILIYLLVISLLDVKAAEDPPGSPWRTTNGLREVFGR